MHTGQQTDLGGQRANLVDAAAIDALAVLQQPGADDLLLQLVADEVEVSGGQLGVLGGDGIAASRTFLSSVFIAALTSSRWLA